ncbi:MAG: 1-(5-phosphoribosyl)-5-amino-4-imidazole-carboxylate carboxylase [Armatimonadetes bacterium CG_4_10_14_3_um_filter_66_18]|nr:nickel pincer cofactor biosynthesis protein LarB [Armatimonadota bacterium]OIO96231.1 MAG: 1-(5-phosphoribosyl)-5-amino-4-imidazole-carboxylate carboxylase [Armatimonadetes bacterium CG2_30_66_41]PIU94383.1 MAG: 1-(5-phosphoribosyl)-5-amino-4-imidazole-carboxylate carboxylase [Armatimonadetes bacterium CG06_land_8_20_14_3_00_66_21]PIX46313.1 MAG: 1-(5-phosphoribosyl)-5-amino-4-imidazole-carboxylate carboxylase [Armatimonadetes bacterium CG_4_8_14_3_um_filter_66_20]PIY37266.1 MAG: 1-(5-phosph
MYEPRIRALLESVRTGATDVDAAVKELRDLPYEDLGFAKVDHHRTLRQGFPEVIFCQGKTPEQVVRIVESLRKRGVAVLATRADAEAARAVLQALPEATYHETARVITVPADDPPALCEDRGFILLCCAGTADLPVAEEAAVTAEAAGARVERLYDVGVAGIHRLLVHRDALERATVIIVVAGMEGALASVVGGLVDKPVIAVPTSVGYGASFNGLAPLLTMLNSCASGVVVVNIDNGFGAGYFAAMLAR